MVLITHVPIKALDNGSNIAAPGSINYFDSKTGLCKTW